MLSLAGVPPLAGFAAKFYIFQSAIRCRLIVLAVIGVLNSVVSAYFYLRVLVVMYMEPEKVPLAETEQGFTGASLANLMMALAVVLLGLFPGMVLTLLAAAFRPDMIDLPFH
jgi:NADH-quinone oxidoreductase subunit N